MKMMSKVLSVAVILALSIVTWNPATIERQASTEVIIQAVDGSDPQAILQAVDGELVAELPVIQSFVARVPEAKIASLGSEQGVLRYSVNHPVYSASEKKAKIGKDNDFKHPEKIDNIYRKMVKADDVKEKGRGVTIAVLDSGIGNDEYSKSELNIIKSVAVNPEASTADDMYGHGTHVAGIINGKGPKEVVGIAPEANLVNVKLGNDAGEVTEVDLLLGLQWVYEFKDVYNIKVANLSVSSTFAESYLQSPISAAVEQLWLNGVTVVVAAGNDKVNTSDVDFAPANDPYIITVGSVDGHGKDDPKDAELSSWSKHGLTKEGVAKPEVTAPGADIVSLLPDEEAILATEHPDSIINEHYFQMSGTSMAAPVVTGTIALMLEANPALTPNQIKAILAETSVAYHSMSDNAKVVNAKKAVNLAKDEKKLAELAPAGYNVWPVSEYVGSSGTTIDYAKLGWRLFGNSNYSEQYLDYTKLGWRTLDWLKLGWRSIDWSKLGWR